MHRAIAVVVGLTAALVQGCVAYDPALDIVSVEPRHIEPSYFRDNLELWPDVPEWWRDDGDYLAFDVVTREYFPQWRWYPSSRNPREPNDPLVTLSVDDCAGRVRQIYQPHPRVIGRTPSGNFAYEKIIRYKHSPDGLARYNVLRDASELCFRIQTVEMPFVSAGKKFRLELDENVRRIAEGA